MLKVGDIALGSGAKNYIFIGYYKDMLSNYIDILMSNFDDIIRCDMSYISPDMMESNIRILKEDYLDICLKDFAMDEAVFLPYTNSIEYKPVMYIGFVKVIGHINFSLTKAMLMTDKQEREELFDLAKKIGTPEECISYSRETGLYDKFNMIQSIKPVLYKRYKEYVQKHLKKVTDKRYANVFYTKGLWLSGTYCNNTFYAEAIGKTPLELYTRLAFSDSYFNEHDISDAEYYYLGV